MPPPLINLLLLGGFGGGRDERLADWRWPLSWLQATAPENEIDRCRDRAGQRDPGQCIPPTVAEQRRQQANDRDGSKGRGQIENLPQRSRLEVFVHRSGSGTK